MSERITWFVPGLAKTAGSKRAFMRPGMRFPVIVDACAKGKDWKADVKAFAVQHWTEAPTAQPVRVRFSFVLPRPQGHYRASKQVGDGVLLKASAPFYNTKRPDVDKLSRAVMDALTGIVWRDDSQVVCKLVSKEYGKIPGVEITIEVLTEADKPDCHLRLTDDQLRPHNTKTTFT